MSERENCGLPDHSIETIILENQSNPPQDIHQDIDQDNLLPPDIEDEGYLTDRLDSNFNHLISTVPKNRNDQRNLNYSIIKLSEKGITAIVGQDLFMDFIRYKDYDMILLVTAYNEGSKEFKSTIDDGINKNIRDLKEAGCGNIAVIVIVDGIIPFYKATKNHESEEGCEKCGFCSDKTKVHPTKGCSPVQYFNDYVDWRKIKLSLGILLDSNENSQNLNQNESLEDLKLQVLENRKVLKSKKVEKAHLFWQNIELKDTSNYDLIFCIKQDNKKKLNTHVWFLKGFCKTLKPNYVVFLDVGTKPLTKSLSPLYTCLKTREEIAGCCGEILPDSKNCSNFVEQAQIVEYKFSHIFDKSFESLFGYISVLPGAFSAYRYECFTEEILNVYFRSEDNPTLSLFEANMYLAEDRILCLELACMAKRKNNLTYIPESKAETDVPDELFKLMMQRRRWNNGTWFSSIYTIKNCNKIFHSGHGRIKKIFMAILMFYYMISALFSWVLVGAFYVSFSISLKRNLQETNNDLNKLNKFSTPIIMFYVSCLIAMVVVSLSAKPEKIKYFLNTLSVIFGFYMILTIILALLFVFRDGLVFIYDVRENISIFFLILTVVGSFLVIVLNSPKNIVIIILGIFQFLSLTGTYVNMFLIYSICNIHDVTWGNRPGSDNSDDQQKLHFEAQRIIWLIIWIISNGLFAYFFNWLSGDQDENARNFIIYFAYITFGVIFVKVLGGLVFVLTSMTRRCRDKFKKH